MFGDISGLTVPLVTVGDSVLTSESDVESLSVTISFPS